MRYEWFIARRIVSSVENRSVATKPIVRLAIAGVSLGFAVMILAVTIVTGFKQEIRDKIVGFGAHIQISNYIENNSFETLPFARDEKFINELRSHPGVEHVQVFATKAGILKKEEEISGVVAKGVGTDFNWKFFQSKLISGKTPQYNDSVRSNEIVISSRLAKKLRISSGDSVLMYFIQQPPRVRKFKVDGIYETGLEEFDNLFLISDINHIRKLNDWEDDEIGGIEILIRDLDELDKISNEIYTRSDASLNTKSIREIYPQIFDWLNLQNINAVIIITLMLLVAGINMISALLIIILERVSMIGTLKALGANNSGVRRVFLSIALVLTGKGLLWGNILGIGLTLIQKHFNIITLDQQSYYISYVPVNIQITDILLLNAGTIFICGLMMILPTAIITRISPLKAIRFS
ncbi:MAG: ABC transporter permease [Bacteroidetes bacterium]|nr:MAG: ABC transporter permease [Bacteroidota bacterium]REK08002.1 MAG: ABC transporter permease [Bacteroidota bacterium]REK32207.1 MAG: ABC transporter permease [Bacteroidota bacterium]REK47359.1 MAG: ABC transporter permease [Bacteroidota bacterium]